MHLPRGAEASGPRAEPTLPVGSESRALSQMLEAAQSRLADAETKASYWHEQRDQLASERDFLFHERERLAAERAEWIAQRDRTSSQHEQLLGERKQLFSERDQLVAERNQLAVEHNQLAGRARRAGPGGPARRRDLDSELQAAQARFAEDKSPAGRRARSAAVQLRFASPARPPALPPSASAAAAATGWRRAGAARRADEPAPRRAVAGQAGRRRAAELAAERERSAQERAAFTAAETAWQAERAKLAEKLKDKEDELARRLATAAPGCPAGRCFAIARS